MTNDILADAREFIADRHERLQTHSEGCWRWHPACMVGRLSREVERLRTIMYRIVDEDCTVAIQGGTFWADGEPLFSVERTPATQPTPGEGSTPGEGTSEPVALGTAHGIADAATACVPGPAERDTTKPRNGAEHAGSAAATRGRIMTNDNEEPSAASAGYGLGSIRRREMDTPIRNRNGMVVGVISQSGGPHKRGDPPPFGYCDWMEWAEVQHKAGLRQRRCVKCDKYRYPQEIARVGRSPVCKECSNG